MESAMTEQPHIPDPETSKRLLANLRRTRLEMAEFNLELAEISAQLEHELRQQRLKRVRRSLNSDPAETKEMTS
jgi:DNA-binding protein H-NS